MSADEHRRKRENDALLKRMRRGEDWIWLSREASAFPPRPTIEKDKAAIARLYGEQQFDESAAEGCLA